MFRLTWRGKINDEETVTIKLTGDSPEGLRERLYKRLEKYRDWGVRLEFKSELLEKIVLRAGKLPF